MFRFLLVFSLLAASMPASAKTLASKPDQVELRLLSADDQQVRLQLITPEYEISAGRGSTPQATEVHVQGIPLDSTPGAPRLPRLARLVAIPPGVEVELTYQSPARRALPGEYYLLSAGEPQALSEDFTQGTYLPDSLFSFPAGTANDGLFPAQPAQLSGEAWLRNQRMARIDFFPFQYDASQARLIWHPDLEITLTFTHKSEKQQPLPAEAPAGPLDTLAEALVVNPQSARLWRDPAWQSATIPLGKSASTSEYAETRYKITVDEDSLYQVTGADLQAAGLDLSQVNPQDFSLSNQGSPAAFLVQDADGNDGEADGAFSLTDRIVFYGEMLRGERMAERYASEDDLWAPMPTGWQPHMTAEMFEKYTDHNVYWLDTDGPAGLRMAKVNGVPTGANLILTQSTAKVHLEQDNRWSGMITSAEDTWFWERITASSTTPVITRTYPLELPSPATSSLPATLQGEIYAQTESPTINPDHHIALSLNGHPIYVGEWDGIGRFSFTVEFDPSYLLPGSNQLTLTLSLLTGMTGETIYIDWFNVTYARQLEAQDDQLFFEYPEMDLKRHYRIEGFSTADIQVLDITNPLAPDVVQILPGSPQGNAYRAEFQAQHPQIAKYLITAGQPKSPLEVERYGFKNLHAATWGADYIIITHADFIAAAQTLVDYRAAQGLRAMVVDLDDIINEFNEGIYHSLAIKSFLAYTMANWVPPAPAYVVLVGNGHWNFFYRPGPSDNYSTAQIYMPPHLAWVDPWQGEVDSAAALTMVVGDDLLPDLAIGRIPVDSPEELAVVIDKIITYEHQSGPVQPDRLLFIADNQPDEAGYFMNISEDVIASSVPDLHIVDRVYLNDYYTTSVCEVKNPPIPCAPATQAIIDHINNEAVDFINYTGHGSRNYWADELLIRTTSLPERINDPAWNDVAGMGNTSHLPVLLSMTCLDGYWIYPSLNFPSLAVNLLKKAGGGVAAAYSPTGLGLTHGHDVLNKAFYDSLYKQGVKELGAAVQFSKLKLYETGQNLDLIYTYTIFGDPALRLATTSGGVFIPYVSYRAAP